MIAALAQGDMAAYQQVLSSRLDALEARFVLAVESFDFWRAGEFLDAYDVARSAMPLCSWPWAPAARWRPCWSS